MCYLKFQCSAKKISLTWNLLAWRAERVAREHYRTSHFQVSQLSFEEISRKTAIMGKDSKESKDIEKVQVEIQVRSVPDGGWGWFICLAGFIAQFVVLGIQNNTGIIYKALLEEFRQSKGETGIYCEFLSICDSTACKPSEVSYLVEHDFKSACSVQNVNPALLNQATGSGFSYPNNQWRNNLRSIPYC